MAALLLLVAMLGQFAGDAAGNGSGFCADQSTILLRPASEVPSCPTDRREDSDPGYVDEVREELELEEDPSSKAEVSHRALRMDAAAYWTSPVVELLFGAAGRNLLLTPLIRDQAHSVLRC